MKKAIVLIIAIEMLHANSLFEFLGGQKKGTTTLLFLKISPGATQVAMGNTGVSFAGDATCLYWNPALASFIKTSSTYSASYRRWVGDQDYAFAGGIKALGKYQRIGVYLIGLSSGYFKETDENHPEGTGNYISSTDFALALVYSRNVSDRFSFGIATKFVYENLAGVVGYIGLVDIGSLYEVGYRDIQIGVSLSNLGPDFGLRGRFLSQTLDSANYEAYPVPVIYRIGFKGRVKDWLLSSFEIEKPSDDVEQFKIGFSLIPMELIHLNIGFRLNNTFPGTSYLTRGVNFGFTVRRTLGLYKGFYLSYAAEQMGYLGISHLITTGVNF